MGQSKSKPGLQLDNGNKPHGRFVVEFAGENAVYGQHVGECGSTPPQWRAFLRMKESVPVGELRDIVLDERSGAVIRCYALWALKDLNAMEKGDVLAMLRDNRLLEFGLGGCSVSQNYAAWFAMHLSTFPADEFRDFILREVTCDLGDFSRNAARQCEDVDLLIHAWRRNGNSHALLAACGQSGTDEIVIAEIIKICKDPDPIEKRGDDDFYWRDKRKLVFDCVSKNPMLIANEEIWTLFEEAALAYSESGDESLALLGLSFTKWNVKAAACLRKLCESKARFHLRWAFQNFVYGVGEKKPYLDPVFQAVGASLYRIHLSQPHHQEVRLWNFDFYEAMALNPENFATILQTEFTVEKEKEHLQVWAKKIVEASSFVCPDLSHPSTRKMFDGLERLIPTFNVWPHLKGKWSPATHKAFPPEFRKSVVQILLAVTVRTQLCPRDVCFLIFNWMTY